VGQQPHAGDVADGPQALTGAQVRVDGDTVPVGLDLDRLQAEPVHARTPARGEEQAVATQLAAVVEHQNVVLAVAPRGGRVHAEDQFGAVAAQDLAERLAQRRRLADEHVPAALDQGHLAAETTHGLRHLGADGPAAEDDQAARDGRHAGHPAASPHSPQVGQARHRVVISWSSQPLPSGSPNEANEP
jgi:hypothetical protein